MPKFFARSATTDLVLSEKLFGSEREYLTQVICLVLANESLLILYLYKPDEFIQGYSNSVVCIIRYVYSALKFCSEMKQNRLRIQTLYKLNQNCLALNKVSALIEVTASPNAGLYSQSKIHISSLSQDFRFL